MSHATPSGSPIRFSVQMTDAATGAAWLDKVKRAEDLGCYSVSVPDHLDASYPQLAPLVALAAAAAATTHVRLATTVIDNDFRHPVMLAKEVATLDVLSGGRVDLGIGAGWVPDDYTRTGICTFDPPGQRVDRLIESLDVIARLFAGEEVTHAGVYYQLDRFRSYPQPVQQPVPLMIGAAGKRMLRMAARRAQIVSLIARVDGVPDRRLSTLERQLQWIEDVRPDRDDLVIGVRVFFGEISAPGEPRRAVAERVAAKMGMEVDDVLTSPYGLVGDPIAVRDHLQEISERHGITYFTLSEDLVWEAGVVISELASA